MTLSELNPKILHDAADERFRSPLGAVETGTPLTLRLRDGSGLVQAAALHLWCDDWEKVLPAPEAADGFAVSFAAPDAPAALWYAFSLTLPDGELWLSAGADGHRGVLGSARGEGFRLTVCAAGFETPAWFRRSVIYQIFPDRFARDDSDTARRGLDYHRALGRRVRFHEGWDEPVDWAPSEAEGFYFPADFYGGTLRGIREKLPYLKRLGVGVLYLNPVFEACSNHRYDTADYLKIDPVLGTEADFRDLCRDAAAAGIRILLDGVFSHTGADSVYFNKFSRYPAAGAYNAGEQSPYYDWYDFRAFPDDYRCWWNFPDLPEVNEEEPSWQDFVITGENAVIPTWLRRGAAGYRLDVADELPDDVLARIRTAVKSVSPDCVVLGEVWEDAVTKTSYGRRRQYALGRALDSVMNYPLRTALIAFFTFRSGARVLADFLLSQRLNYPLPLYGALMNLLSSHDVERIRTALATRLDVRALTREQQAGFVVTDAQDARGAAMQRLCAAVQFALPGVPGIYYGDEAGMNGLLDPFDRAPFAEGARPLTDWYAALAALRNAHPALATGHAAFSAPAPDVLCVLRFVSGGQDAFGCPAEDGVFLCAVNRAGEERRFVADLWLPGAGLGTQALDALRALPLTRGTCLLTGSEISVADGLADLTLPPESARLFRLL